MHAEALKFVRDSLAAHPPRGRVLEIGSYYVNGTVRGLFPDCEFVGLDLRPGLGVDIVCDASTYFADPFDCVVCVETLEHAPDPVGICVAALRLLKPGGLFIVTTAGPHREPHSLDGVGLPAGEHYRNVSTVDLLEWLHPFERAMVCEGRGGMDVYATAVR